MLGLHGRRQDDVGEVGGVGHPLLQHDREEVVAEQAGADAPRSGEVAAGLQLKTTDRADRRVVELVQRLAEP